MRRFNLLSVLILSVLGGAALALADVKVEKQTLGPDGESFGCSISPHGSHVAVLAAKGSRFVVLLDGVEGPRIDALLVDVCGHVFQTGSYWSGQIPVLFSDDGSHNAYIAKMGGEYVVMLDGKELARGPIVTAGQATSLPLEFSAGGKHLFYMDADSAGKYRVVVDGKPGPGSTSPPQLVISGDGAHYAYVSPDRPANGQQWAVVDGRQVNYFGDNLQYTGRNVLVSKTSVNGTNALFLNGKPEIKALNLQPMWISPDGAQIAVVITPRNGVTFLAVNGKVVPGAQGLVVEDVFFSPDGKRYAARCDTKTGSKFMIIDGKKGEEYQDIPHQGSWNGSMHYTFLTGTQVTNIDTARLPVRGSRRIPRSLSMSRCRGRGNSWWWKTRSRTGFSPGWNRS